MPFDAVFLSAVCGELNPILAGARAEKIAQPERDEIIIAMRTRERGHVKLLISLGNARIHLTTRQRENPAAPPMFCMLLRKHLTGARLLGITQPPRERAVTLDFEATDELGDRVTRKLTAELAGNRANLLLLDGENRIIECLRRTDGDVTEARPALPGLFYRPLTLPPGKLPPDKLADWDGDCSDERSVVAAFAGISPLIAREIVIDKRRCAEIINSGAFEPILIRKSGEPFDFTYMPVRQYGDLCETERFGTFSELADTFFGEKSEAEYLKRKSAPLRKTVKNLCERSKRKLAAQRGEFSETEGRGVWREYGDIIMANLHKIRRGDAVARLNNFYAEGEPETDIPLDPKLTPHQNAARCYKKFTKLKTAAETLSATIPATIAEGEYFEAVLDELNRAETPADVEEIREELAAGGFIPKPGGAKKRSKPSEPFKYKSASGFDIYAGRNNRQNDTLTLKTAAKTDMWLHTQKIHGSHVIIDCGGRTPDEETLREAAKHAVFHSQARNGVKVPVDYTLVKYVKKAAGGKPGMVIYERFKTVIV